MYFYAQTEKEGILLNIKPYGTHRLAIYALGFNIHKHDFYRSLLKQF
jgi:hypothetical protein